MPSSTAEIAVARNALGERAREWHKDTATGYDLSPVAVVTLADRAIADARGAVQFVADSFTGTPPPPPWPAGPELLTAAGKVTAHRDAAEVIARRTPAAKFKDPARVRAALVRDGDSLYAQADELLNKLGTSKKITDLLPHPSAVFAALPVYLFAFGLWWLLSDTPRRTRLAGI